ncbi:MAG: hypothetical protein ACK56I_28830 [bacterium]
MDTEDGTRPGGRRQRKRVGESAARRASAEAEGSFVTRSARSFAVTGARRTPLR